VFNSVISEKFVIQKIYKKQNPCFRRKKKERIKE